MKASYLKQLSKNIHEIMIRPDPAGKDLLVLKSTLLVFSKIYQAVVAVRGKLYDWGVFKTKRLPCFVISVGNIAVGGTGKTPMTIYLADHLASSGLKTAVITRGYGGKLEQTGGVVSDGKKIHVGPDEAGDEPYMMAKRIRVPIIAGKNRYASGRIAVEQFSAQVLIIDDGFQHRKIERDLDLVLMDSRTPMGNGFLLPRGILRESPGCAQRSDALIFTRCDNRFSPVFKTLPSCINGLPQFKSMHKPCLYDYQNPKDPESGSKRPDLDRLKGKHVTLFSGIAQNSDFRKTCETVGMIVDGHLKFIDHHRYSALDIKKIISAFDKNRSDLVVTTHKDYTKVTQLWQPPSPIAVLDVGIEFQKEDEQRFHAFLKEKLNPYFGKATR